MLRVCLSPQEIEDVLKSSNLKKNSTFEDLHGIKIKGALVWSRFHGADLYGCSSKEVLKTPYTQLKDRR